MSDYIPEELVSNILLRLPAKSLLRFRCISKLWNSLISYPEFVSKHIYDSYISKTPTPPPRILIRHYSRNRNDEVYSVYKNNEAFDVDEDIKISFPFRRLTSSHFRIVGFCNGLLCLLNDMNMYCDLILWNPLVRKNLTPPMPPSHSKYSRSYMPIMGFGYDVENKDFKVIRVAYIKGDYGYNFAPIVEIFSLKTRIWREINTNLRHNWLIELFWSQALVHGKLHWVACQMRLMAYAGNGVMRKCVNLIMAFDFSREVFEEIVLPSPLISARPTSINSAVYEEKLALIVSDVQFDPSKSSIWVMEEYGSRESWIKMFNLEFNFLGNVFGVTKGGYLALTLKGHMVLYHPETEETSSLGIFLANGSTFVDAYTESLALLIEGEQD